MHCAAYRGHKETAVLLLQNGIDNQIRNHMGQKALELAKDPQMIQILSVKSVRRVQKSVNRFEGPLLRRSRFLGWRPVWVKKNVLNKLKKFFGVNKFDFVSSFCSSIRLYSNVVS